MKLSPRARRLLFLFSLLIGLFGCIGMRGAFAPEIYNNRDLLNDYLATKAYWHGLNPYTPLSELARQFDCPLPPGVFNHPTSHAPGLLLLSLPIGLLDYYTANLIWLGFSLLCLLLSIYLLQQDVKSPTRLGRTFWLSWVALAWGPLMIDLVLGQINTWLLLLAVAAWLSLRAGRELLGGALLGMMLVLKLIFWPFGLYLLWRRQWRALGGMSAMFGLMHLIAVAVLGATTIKDYYLRVGPAVSHLYHAYVHNLALTSWGWRLFQGTGDSLSLPQSMLVPPVIESVSLARVSAWLLPLLVLAISLLVVGRARSFTTAFCLLLCASLLTAPLCWSHYFTVLLFPLTILVRRLAQADTPAALRWSAYLVFLLMALPYGLYVSSAEKFGVKLADSNITALPFAASLLLGLGTFLVLGWMYLLWRTDCHDRLECSA